MSDEKRDNADGAEWRPVMCDLESCPMAISLLEDPSTPERGYRCKLMDADRPIGVNRHVCEPWARAAAKLLGQFVRGYEDLWDVIGEAERDKRDNVIGKYFDSPCTRAIAIRDGVVRVEVVEV